jgi:hypothetical protein
MSPNLPASAEIDGVVMPSGISCIEPEGDQGDSSVWLSPARPMKGR